MSYLARRGNNVKRLSKYRFSVSAAEQREDNLNFEQLKNHAELISVQRANSEFLMYGAYILSGLVATVVLYALAFKLGKPAAQWVGKTGGNLIRKFIDSARKAMGKNPNMDKLVVQVEGYIKKLENGTSTVAEAKELSGKILKELTEKKKAAVSTTQAYTKSIEKLTKALEANEKAMEGDKSKWNWKNVLKGRGGRGKSLQARIDKEVKEKVPKIAALRKLNEGIALAKKFVEEVEGSGVDNVKKLMGDFVELFG